MTKTEGQGQTLKSMNILSIRLKEKLIYVDGK